MLKWGGKKRKKKNSGQRKQTQAHSGMTKRSGTHIQDVSCMCMCSWVCYSNEYSFIFYNDSDTCWLHFALSTFCFLFLSVTLVGSDAVVPREVGTLLILSIVKQPIQQRIHTGFILEGIEKWCLPYAD